MTNKIKIIKKLTPGGSAIVTGILLNGQKLGAVKFVSASADTSDCGLVEVTLKIHADVDIEEESENGKI